MFSAGRAFRGREEFRLADAMCHCCSRGHEEQPKKCDRDLLSACASFLPTWTQTSVERRLSSWRGGLCTSMSVGGRERGRSLKCPVLHSHNARRHIGLNCGLNTLTFDQRPVRKGFIASRFVDRRPFSKRPPMSFQVGRGEV